MKKRTYTEGIILMKDISEEPPKRIELDFGEDAGITELVYTNIKAILEYWAGSPAIATDAEVSRRDNCIYLDADFDEGYFGGDLTRHDAIGLGDDKFQIGLVKLLIDGHTAKTERGQDVTRALRMPYCIRFIYGSEKSSSVDEKIKVLVDIVESNLDYAQRSLRLLRGEIGG